MLLAVYHIYFFFLVDSQHKIQFIEVVHQQQLVHSIGDTSMKVQVHRQQSPKKKKKRELTRTLQRRRWRERGLCSLAGRAGEEFDLGRGAAEFHRKWERTSVGVFNRAIKLVIEIWHQRRGEKWSEGRIWQWSWVGFEIGDEGNEEFRIYRREENMKGRRVGLCGLNRRLIKRFINGLGRNFNFETRLLTKRLITFMQVMRAHNLHNALVSA